MSGRALLAVPHAPRATAAPRSQARAALSENNRNKKFRRRRVFVSPPHALLYPELPRCTQSNYTRPGSRASVSVSRGDCQGRRRGAVVRGAAVGVPRGDPCGGARRDSGVTAGRWGRGGGHGRLRGDGFVSRGPRGRRGGVGGPRERETPAGKAGAAGAERTLRGAGRGGTTRRCQRGSGKRGAPASGPGGRGAQVASRWS